jgi:hypothetical protein
MSSSSVIKLLTLEIVAGWDKLSWEAKLDAALMLLRERDAVLAKKVEAQRQNLQKGSSFSDAVQREIEGLDNKVVVDPEKQREVHRDPQRVELVNGNTIDGLTKWHTQDQEEQRERWKAKKGKQVRQLFEECEKCGRPCEVKGSGL